MDLNEDELILFNKNITPGDYLGKKSLELIWTSCYSGDDMQSSIIKLLLYDLISLCNISDLTYLFNIISEFIAVK